MSTPVQIHHPSPTQSRGLVIFEANDENEPKTLLEIGGVTRPNPTYSLLTSTSLLQSSRPSAIMSTVHHSPTQHHIWINEDTQESIPPHYIPYTDLQDHKGLRFSNGSWNLSDRQKSMLKKSPDHQGKF